MCSDIERTTPAVHGGDLLRAGTLFGLELQYGYPCRKYLDVLVEGDPGRLFAIPGRGVEMSLVPKGLPGKADSYSDAEFP